MKPLIGVTALVQSDGRYAVHQDYTNAILAAGGVPVLLPLYTDSVPVDAWLCHVDGVLLTGGADIDPAYYGEAPHEKTEPDPVRDPYELSLCRALYEHNIPTLGICRGVQVMGVALGGTLHQHVEGHSGGVAHRVCIPPDAPPCMQAFVPVQEVNSFHHQAIKEIPPTAKALAYAEDGGVCEGIWFAELEFFVGVQWHPERRSSDALSKALFAELVKTAHSRQGA